MPTVHFLGAVLPLFPEVSCGDIPRALIEDHAGMTVNMKVSIVRSLVRVECETNRFDESDLGYLYMRAMDLSRTAVNLVAFASGHGLTVHLHTFQSPDGSIGPLRIIDQHVARYCTAYKLDPNFDDEIREICGMVFEDSQLYIALNDLIEAITFPHSAAISCARAMEAIRNIIAPGKRRKGWSLMHAALNTTEKYIGYITELSEAPRHGDHSYIEEPILQECVIRSWIVMNRFLVFKRRGGQPLSVDEFETLTGETDAS